MKEKVLKLITVIALIIALTSINVLFLGYHIVIALASELESQGNSTNIADVQFDTYFKGDNGNTHYQQANMRDEEMYLYINVNVLEKGSVDNAKIKINDSNFKIKDSNNSNTYVKNINLDTNEIELNSIIYHTNVEIEIPIEFNQVDNINADYFSKETNITLEGTYKEEEDQEALQGDIAVRLEWTDNAEVNMSQSIEKCIDLGESGILIQQQIATTVENGNLPREAEQFTVMVPRIGDTLPTNIDVLSNGTKLSESYVQYNAENGQLNVTKDIVIDGEGKTSWDSNIDEYKIIYMYDPSVKDSLTNITLHTEMNSKLFTKGNMTKTDEQQIQLAWTGNVVSSKKTATSELYKGYLYANSANETTYRENNVIEISNAEVIDSIQATTNNSYFVDGGENSYDANAIVIYKETLINKNRFIQLFGENGYIYVKDANGNVIHTVNNQSETDESGNIHITYEQPLTGVVFETSKPVEEGQFTIHHVKAIQGNTGYSRDQLKAFARLNTNEVIVTNIGTDTIETGINLLDTTTEATLELSTTSFSTLQENKNVQFMIVLKSSSNQYDLFKNPQIDITIPKELNINVKTISQLNEQEQLQIDMTGIKTLDNGDKLIRIQLVGEQTNFVNSVNEGIQIAFMADITIDNTVPSQDSKIMMSYTNENRPNETFHFEQPIRLNSKYGVLTTSQLTGYNNENDVIQGMNNQTISGELDTNTEEKNATETVHIINNYEEAISNIAIIGKIPAVEEENINNELVTSTFEMNLLNTINLNGREGTVYYSEDANASVDSDSWTDNYNAIEKAKSFKIEFGALQPGEVAKVDYQVNIPANLENNQETYLKNTVNYTYLGNTNQITSAAVLGTEQGVNMQSEGEVQQDEDISLNIVARTGDQYLTSGDAVKEGQGITYDIQVTNVSDTDLQNVQIEAMNSNAIYYDTITYQDEVNGVMMDLIKIDENPDLTSKQFAIDTLEAGETRTISYQISVKEDVAGETLNGEIKVKADNLDEKTFANIENTIEDAELKLTLRNGFSEDVDIVSNGDQLAAMVNVKNISDKELQDVIVSMPLGDDLYFVPEDFFESEEGKYEFVGYENKIIQVRIPTLQPGETVEVGLGLMTEKMDIELTEKTVRQYYTAIVNDVTYTSNEIQKNIKQTESIIEANQTSNIEGNTITDGENIIFTIHVANTGAIEKNLNVTDDLPIGLNVNEAYLLRGTERENLEVENNVLNFEIVLQPNEEIDVIIDTSFDMDLTIDETITNYVMVSGNNVELQIDPIEFTIIREIEPKIEIVQTSDIQGDTLLTGDSGRFTFTITNTGIVDRNIQIIDELQPGFTFDKACIIQGVDIIDLSLDNHAINTNLTLPAGESIELRLDVIVDASTTSEDRIANYATVITDGKSFQSNVLEYTIQRGETTSIEALQSANIQGNTVANGDNIIFNIHIVNDGSETTSLQVVDQLQDVLQFNEAYILQGEQQTQIDIQNRAIRTNIELAPGEAVDLFIDVTVNTNLEDTNQIRNYATITGDGIDITTNILTYTITQGGNTSNGTYDISGQAWIDSNENGQKEDSEAKLGNVIVMLIDENTGNIVTNTNGQAYMVTTDSEGRYSFTGLQPGAYMVFFQYDTNKYALTEYKKADVDESINSDIISKRVNINGEELTVGSTETLAVTSENLENIDAGFIEGKLFDLRLDKYVSTIVVQNSAGTVTRGYNKQNLVKIELDARELAGSTVIIEYSIEVTNEGEIAGYANEIVDYMPSDLQFSSELNKDWYQTTDGAICNKVLENEIINPGETKILTLTLTKQMTQNNTGNVINTAEINRSSNDYGTIDIDSEAGNKKDGEDDMSTAEVIISIRTGAVVMYIGLIFAVIVIIAVGVYFINKKTLNHEEIL